MWCACESPEVAAERTPALSPWNRGDRGLSQGKGCGQSQCKGTPNFSKRVEASWHLQRNAAGCHGGCDEEEADDDPEPFVGAKTC